MTPKERLILMDDIKRKNDIAWSKYAKQPRQHWTWEADVRKPFNPFAGFGARCILAICVPPMLALFLMMSA